MDGVVRRADRGLAQARLARWPPRVDPAVIRGASVTTLAIARRPSPAQEAAAMTAIRDVDLSQPLPHLDDLADADACMVILRWRRRVVGRFTVPVRLGAIEQD